MVFNSNKGFFLTLDDAAAPATLELPQQEAPATEEAPVEAAVVAASEPSEVAQPSAPEAVEETVAETSAASSAQPATSLTTAEAIAAELAAAEASRPAMPALMHNMGQLEYQNDWGRCWVDLGTSDGVAIDVLINACLLYTSPSPRDKRQSRMPSSA